MIRFRVLLVDDEAELLSALVERLKLRDIEATAAITGAEAVECVEKEDYDVAVIDVKMPKMGGVECMKRIKSLKPDLRVILLTGHGSQEDQKEGWDEGAFDYLMKPIKIDRLIEKMEEAVDASRGGK